MAAYRLALQEMTRERVPLQWAMTQMNLQLANVISDLSGVTGQKIVRAIVAGERDPRKLAAGARMLADLHDQLHAIAAPDWLRHIDGADRLLHLDLHPMNVMIAAWVLRLAYSGWVITRARADFIAAKRSFPG